MEASRLLSAIIRERRPDDELARDAPAKIPQVMTTSV